MTMIHHASGVAAAAGGVSEIDFGQSFIQVFAPNDPFFSAAQFSVYGDVGSLSGQWRRWINGAAVETEDWETAASLPLSNYFIRLTNVTGNNVAAVSTPDPDILGPWTNRQTRWRSLSNTFTIQEPTISRTIAWNVVANSSVPQPDIGLSGLVQIGRLDTGFDVVFEAAQVSVGADQFQVNGHGLITGDFVRYNIGGGAAPSPLVDGNYYAVIRDNDNAFRLATTIENAAAGTDINITFTGTGTGHTFTPIKSKGEVNIDVEASGLA